MGAISDVRLHVQSPILIHGFYSTQHHWLFVTTV